MTTPTTKEKPWSAYQRAVFRAVSAPGGHLVVEALAGSGKTTTIIEALMHTNGRESALLCAFNKAIAAELKPKAPAGVDVMTLHSYGYRSIQRALGHRQIDRDQVKKFAKILLAKAEEEELDERTPGEKRAELTAICDLVSACKAALAFELTEIDAIADAAEIELPPPRRELLVTYVQKILNKCSHGQPAIDFDDMIWLPIVRKFKVQQYDWVFVDETQDLTPAQLALVRAACGGRIVAVGDRRQSIYGFSGADSRAIPRMISELGAHVLPLSICYRCPRLVVEKAQKLVPAIEAAPGAPDGLVREASVEQLRDKAAPGDFVVSRKNAPLVSLAFRWIAMGRRCSIRGRNIGEGLVAWVRKTGARSITELVQHVADWEDGEVERLEALDRDTGNVMDRAECLRAVCEGMATPTAVIERLQQLFSDDDPAGAIILTSTHRAKGLEADRVWLLRDTYMQPRKRRKHDRETWEEYLADPFAPPKEEEENLLYVAITRSKQELVFVHGLPGDS